MGNQPASLSKSEVHELTHVTAFDAKELDDLHKVFVALDTDHSGELDRTEFQQLFKYRPIFKRATPESMNRLFDTFDTDHSGSVSFKELAVALSTLGKGTVESKLNYLFSVFDTDGSGTLERPEVVKILEHMLCVADALGRSGPKTRDFVEGVLRKLEAEGGSGNVTRERWVSVGARTPSLLLFLGAIDESEL
ncbi:calcium-binding protein [Pelomyxa schiedti]|nr:calcium-binding protein [Pelomyxa schiedti]